MQDLHQIADTLLPNVESVLPGGTGHDVLPVSRETAALPWSPEGGQQGTRDGTNAPEAPPEMYQPPPGGSPLTC